MESKLHLSNFCRRYRSCRHDSVLSDFAVEANILCVILLCLASGLLYGIGFWRRKTADAAFAAAQTAGSDEQRDRFCRMAVLAGHRDKGTLFS